jgi:hypothetical protein
LLGGVPIKSADGAGYGADEKSASVTEDIGAWVIAAAEHAEQDKTCEQGSKNAGEGELGTFIPKTEVRKSIVWLQVIW